MKTHFKILHANGSDTQRGAVVILVAVLAFMFVGLAALTIDVHHLLLVRNELQNAADAGALAGARVLYNDAGTSVNAGANQEAYDAAVANKAVSTAGTIAVDVNWTSGSNAGDVQRGHWSFTTSTFTPNDTLSMVGLAGKTKEELDVDPNFINAVRVVARRDATRAESFFARIFGYEDFTLAAEAVAYKSFAGTINPHEVDLPIVICQEAILKDGEYSCEYGRMLNSGSKAANIDDHNTGGWTDFSVQTICSGTNTNDMRDVLDGCGGNPVAIPLGSFIGTSGGVADNLIDHPGNNMPDVMTCWKNALYDSDGDGVKDASIDTDNDGWPDKPWNVNLPVVECPENNIATCSKLVGSVNVDIVWILEDSNDINVDAPYKMGDWSNSSPDGVIRWNEFVTNFDLRTVDGDLATYSSDPALNGFKKKSLYFLPDCTPNEPSGVTGGENFGVPAKYPVLVK